MLYELRGAAWVPIPNVQMTVEEFYQSATDDGYVEVKEPKFLTRMFSKLFS